VDERRAIKSLFLLYSPLAAPSFSPFFYSIERPTIAQNDLYIVPVTKSGGSYWAIVAQWLPQ